MRGEFQFDDDRLIRFNFALRDLSDWRPILKFEPYRPVSLASFAINFAIGKKDPFSYHLVNVLLHATTAILFFLLLRRTSENLVFCALSAVLFAVHPLNTESVAYISGRFLLLCSVFYLAAMHAFDLYLRRQNGAALLLFLVLSGLAILSKEEGALIPLAAIVYNFVFFGLPSVKKHRVLHLATFLAVTAGALYRILLEMQAGNLPHGVMRYFATEVHVWLRYLWLALFPMRLNVDHDIQALSLFSPAFWFSLVAMIFILFGLWKIRKSHAILFFWCTWFFLNLLASSSFVPLNDFMAEHRTYLSVMGFCAASGYLGVLFRKQQVRYSRLIAISLTLLILLFSAATLIRNRVWETKLTLWYDSVSKSPKKFRPHLNLAYALFERGAYQEAIQEYSIARDLEPMVPRIHTGLAFCYLSLGRFSEAETSWNLALKLDPRYIDAKTGLGILRYREGKFNEALHYFEQTYPQRKESVELISMMAVCFLNTDQRDRAIDILRAGRSLSEQLDSALKLVEQGNLAEAIEVLRTAGVSPAK